jgi:hypothetical protein
LDNIGDRLAIDLKMESQIPSKVRSPQNNDTPTWLGAGGSDRNSANENQNQKELAGEIVSCLHGRMLRSRRVPAKIRKLSSRSKLPSSPGSIIPDRRVVAKIPQGSKACLLGGEKPDSNPTSR